MGPRIVVALPSTDATLTEELGHMLSGDLSDLGAETSVLRDEDVAHSGADAIIILGDILFSDQAVSSLRRTTRPRTVLWQLEAVPPAEHFKSNDNHGVKARAKYALERAGIRFLKPLVPAAMRTPLLSAARSVAWRNALRDGPSGDQPDGYWGFHRVERVKAMKAATDGGLLDAVFAGTPERADAISAAGVDCTYLSIGYHPAMDPPADTERDIDVLFLGGLTLRRSQVIEGLRERMAARGLSFRAEHGPVYGADRARLLGRAKISLNIGHVDHEIPRIRAILSMAAGALFLSEKRGATTPFREGTHMITAPLEEIPDVAAHYIRNNQEWLTITDAARSILVDQLSMKGAAQELLEAVHIARGTGD